MSHLATALARLGRWASPLFLIGVFTGVLLPRAAAWTAPFLLPAILLPFVVALIKLEPQALLRHARRPWLVLALVAWSLLASPVIVAIALLPTGLDPELVALTITTAACAPLMASGALAMLLGLDVTLALLVVVPATALIPFTVPPIAFWLAGLSLDLPAAALSLRLAALVLGSGLLAWLLRRWLGPARLRAAAPQLDGLAVLGFVLFAVGVMDGFTATALDRPDLVLRIVLLVFALNIGLQALTALLLLPFVRRRAALTGGLVAGNNNMGLILASVIDTAPATMLLYVAAAQFPIYLLPIIQRRLYPRWLARGN